MNFATPLLLVLAPVVLALLAWRWWRRPGARPALVVADFEVLRAAAPPRTWRMRLRWLPTALRVVALLLVVFALARPQRGLALTVLPEDGIDMVVSFDLSGSMQQPTISGNGRAGVSKLDAARAAVKDFVETLEGDRVGLVVFQAQSLVMSPLTVDRKALQRTVETMQPGVLQDGTAIGLGLAESLNLLRNSEARSRVVVLLTDGQNNSGEIEPLDAARLAEVLDIRVYTIGFVQRAGDVDETMLRKIAEDTGGAYYNAATQTDLQRAYDDISKLERSRVGERRFTRYQEFGPWLAAAAVAVLACEAALRASLLRRYP